MSLLQQLLRARKNWAHVFRNLDLRTCEELELDHLLPSFKPSLYYLPLATRRDPRHLLDLGCGVSLLLHTFERAKAQADNTSLLVDGFLDSADDECLRL